MGYLSQLEEKYQSQQRKKCSEWGKGEGNSLDLDACLSRKRQR